MLISDQLWVSANYEYRIIKLSARSYIGASLIHNNIYVRITPYRYMYAHVTYRPRDDYLQAEVCT